VDIQFNYEPLCPKILDFHKSSARKKLLLGGWGSGKTTAACAEAITLGLEYPNNLVAVCRNTFGELDRSTRVVLQDLLPAEIVRKPYSAADHSTFLTNGTQIVFFPLDDVGKLKSLNAGVIVLDEASETSEEMAVTLWGRRGRRKGIPSERQCFLIASNPTLTSHWLYKWFEGKEHDPDVYFAKLTTYDNQKYLPAGYIRDLEKSLTPDMFQRYVMGEWGHVTFGERIFPEFSLSLHVGFPEFDPALPIIRCWDFGWVHPACVWMQIDGFNRVRVLAELMGRTQVIERFAEDALSYGDRLFPGARYEDYGDRAGDRADPRGVSAETAMSILQDKLSINVHYRSGSTQTSIKNGLDLIRRKLGHITEGVVDVLFHKERCRLLIEGCAGGYACTKDRQGQILKDVPREDGYYEHPQDAWRYGMINKFAIDMDRYKERVKGIRPHYAPTFDGTSY
jgi:Phage terminase large subunit